jgi:hypothetical protein
VLEMRRLREMGRRREVMSYEMIQDEGNDKG